MYNLQGCYVDCGWAAYAYINSWNSVYQGNYYKYAAIQVHELGHNFNLAHSGGLDGATYTDHTCSMGNPLYGDNLGKMCYNPAKNWQIGWYDNANGKMLLDPRGGSASFDTQVLTLVGIAEYNIRTNTVNQPVVVKLETGATTDYFIGFNRAVGANSQNDEADNEVTIILANGGSYSQSSLQATLIEGETHPIPNFANGGNTLYVKAVDIDITSTPGVATICITYDASGSSCSTVPQPTNQPTPPPTNLPTNPPIPTNPPTNVPTSPPTEPQPTKNPTLPPTNVPTSAPTTSPTNSPLVCDCAGLTGGNECPSACGGNSCIWLGGKSGCGCQPIGGSC
jgi:hypothetical protein